MWIRGLYLTFRLWRSHLCEGYVTFCHAAQCAVQKHKGIWQSDLSSAAWEQKDNRAAVLRLTPLMTPRVWCSRLLMSCHTWDQPPSSHWYLHALTAPETAATKPCKLILYSCSFYYSLRSFQCTLIWVTVVLFFFMPISWTWFWDFVTFWWCNWSNFIVHFKLHYVTTTV